MFDNSSLEQPYLNYETSASWDSLRSQDGMVHFVVDGGPALGYGHIGRCLALLEELNGAGSFEVNHPEAEAYLQRRGVKVAALADERLVLIDKAVPTNSATVAALQASGRSVCLLDDFGSGRRNADLVVDPPTAASWPPAGGRRMAGFDHVLIRAEVRAVRPHVSNPPTVLLGLGGSDPRALTPLLADAMDRAGVQVKVALGPGYQGPRPQSGTVLATDRDWPAALGRAALVVTGYGHSLLEAAFLGVPAIAVVTFAAQVEHAMAFAKSGTAVFVDASAGLDACKVVRAVTELLGKPHLLKSMAYRASRLVDGRGAARVEQALRALL